MESLHPVVSCEQARQFEATLFGEDENLAWAAMQRAGGGIARAILADFNEIGRWPQSASIVVLAGKGHNAGDALIAAAALATRHPDLSIAVWLVYGERALRPLAARALRDLVQAAPTRVAVSAAVPADCTVLIDGLFGYQFRPPLDPRASAALKKANELKARLRAAVDLPSGGAEPGAFKADFTYATGLLKAPLLELPHAGRLRFLDLGFEAAAAFPSARDWIAGEGTLEPLRRFRAPTSDKRTFGHLFLLGGSRSYPGAILMSALAAIRSGVGLVTAFVPVSLAPAFAARLPEVMWVGWPETPDGGLAMEGTHLLRDRLDRADAFLLGPGLTREPESLALVADLVSTLTIPVVLDADALQPEIVALRKGPTVLTPHAGEFKRISGGADFPAFAAKSGKVIVLKGPITRISDGRGTVHSLFGGPVLARGGSGDLLAGMIAGRLAQQPDDLRTAAIQGAVWHGRAADCLAQAHGAVAVQTTQLLDFLPTAVRAGDQALPSD